MTIIIGIAIFLALLLVLFIFASLCIGRRADEKPEQFYQDEPW